MCGLTFPLEGSSGLTLLSLDLLLFPKIDLDDDDSTLVVFVGALAFVLDADFDDSPS
jgi:hypothetical protein